jgi:hypothetical protein
MCAAYLWEVAVSGTEWASESRGSDQRQVRSAESDQEDCCDEVAGEPDHEPGRNGGQGQDEVQTGVSARGQVAPVTLTAIDGGGQPDQQHGERDADGPRGVAEAEHEGCDQQRGRGHELEGRMHMDGYRSEQTHRAIQSTNVCAICL